MIFISETQDFRQHDEPKWGDRNLWREFFPEFRIRNLINVFSKPVKVGGSITLKHFQHYMILHVFWSSVSNDDEQCLMMFSRDIVLTPFPRNPADRRTLGNMANS